MLNLMLVVLYILLNTRTESIDQFYVVESSITKKFEQALFITCLC